MGSSFAAGPQGQGRLTPNGCGPIIKPLLRAAELPMLLALTGKGPAMDRLYELIGGGAAISALVSRFYQKVLADERLSPFFAATDMENLRARQAMFLTMLLGGSRSFTGRDLTTAHAGARTQGMTDFHFDLVLRYFEEALTEMGVDARYIREILRLLDTTRAAVLGRQG
jgi:hemoglobin